MSRAEKLPAMQDADGELASRGGIPPVINLMQDAFYSRA
jgi:hypothetical protein